MTGPERAALVRDAAEWLRMARENVERYRISVEELPAALREFADRLEAEAPPVDYGPGIGGVALGGRER